MRHILITLLTCISIIGCSTSPKYIYTGDKIPQDQMAIIQRDFETKHSIRVTLNKRVRIVKIDNKTIEPLAALFDEFYTKQPKIYIEQGKHIVDIQYEYGSLFANTKLWFVAESGKSYSAKAKTKSYSVFMWIEDDSTGEHVGGVVGSVDEPEN